MKWIKASQLDDSHLVFCHNDAQYGNILRLNKVEKSTPEHHQIIVVDFEYASPNPAAFDIANHFHEWTANYHGPTPHLLDASRYPTPSERRTFLTAYLKNRAATADLSAAALEGAVRAWSPSSHAMWAVWALVQAREDVQAHVTQPEFDYVGYARGRMAAFYRELAALSM